ncbi:SAM hydrolase/SAM-dependent halogenase family protein [Magnetococcus sp. PR-3]|uniref:SAM hydrolase/SAM-dependent halogenase family protein n=1 Tax=Magnetococcus sp. PR-3 TaxID=3120355 RepID=UPI002FCE02D4
MEKVVLLTDFGTKDPYVGQVKGRLGHYDGLLNCIDFYHEVPDYLPTSGAWLIERCQHHFPPDSHWLCVVDPGVGSERRGIAVIVGDRLFVGPDNGLLCWALTQDNAEVRAIGEQWQQQAASTFHGRDIFAPVLVDWMTHKDADRIGPKVEDPISLSDENYRMQITGGMQVQIPHIDHFGNIITALDGSWQGVGQGSAWVLKQTINKWVKTFSDLQVGELGLLVGGFGTVEIVCNQGSAAERLNINCGDWVDFFEKSVDDKKSG